MAKFRFFRQKYFFKNLILYTYHPGTSIGNLYVMAGMHGPKPIGRTGPGARKFKISRTNSDQDSVGPLAVPE